MSRNFIEERRWQLIHEELNKVVDKVFAHDLILGEYMRNQYRNAPELALLLRAAERTVKTGKSPYTKRIKKNAHR